MAASPQPASNPSLLNLLSIVIPARDEEGCVAETVEQLHAELKAHDIPHEIIVVDDGSRDATWTLLSELALRLPELKPRQNKGRNGIGRAILCGLDHICGDAVVIMMADQSDAPSDVVRYWNVLNEGWDCVMGSRFVKGGKVIDYPRLKLIVNRIANFFIRMIFHIKLNDTTNAFKAYRRTVIDGCRPIISPHFNILVEIPLKAIVRGYSWTVMPITWRNRKTGVPKLKIREMGSRYLFICMYVWLEKYFSRGDYIKQPGSELPVESPPSPVSGPVPETAPDGRAG
jgi:dolichol-phosphate mannosyltransferase